MKYAIVVASQDKGCLLIIGPYQNEDEAVEAARVAFGGRCVWAIAQMARSFHEAVSG